jgi:hypothetical protein
MQRQTKLGDKKTFSWYINIYLIITNIVKCNIQIEKEIFRKLQLQNGITKNK